MYMFGSRFDPDLIDFKTRVLNYWAELYVFQEDYQCCVCVCVNSTLFTLILGTYII